MNDEDEIDELNKKILTLIEESIKRGSFVALYEWADFLISIINERPSYYDFNFEYINLFKKEVAIYGKKSIYCRKKDILFALDEPVNEDGILRREFCDENYVLEMIHKLEDLKADNLLVTEFFVSCLIRDYLYDQENYNIGVEETDTLLTNRLYNEMIELSASENIYAQTIKAIEQDDNSCVVYSLADSCRQIENDKLKLLYALQVLEAFDLQKNQVLCKEIDEIFSDLVLKKKSSNLDRFFEYYYFIAKYHYYKKQYQLAANAFDLCCKKLNTHEIAPSLKRVLINELEFTQKGIYKL